MAISPAEVAAKDRTIRELRELVRELRADNNRWRARMLTIGSLAQGNITGCGTCHTILQEIKAAADTEGKSI